MSQGAGIASIIGLLGLLWGVSQFYATLDLAFSRIFSDAPERDFARRTLRGFVWVLLLIGAVLVVIILAGLSSFLDTLLPDGSIDAPGPDAGHVAADDPRVRGGGGHHRLSRPAAEGAALAVDPAGHPRRDRDHAADPALHGLVPFLVGAAAIAGSLASAFVALAWLSFSFQALLYGASWVRVAELRAAAGEAATA